MPTFLHFGIVLASLWRSWKGLGGSWALLGGSWTVLEASWGVLERLGTSWGRLGDVLVRLGFVFEWVLERLGGVLVASWKLLGGPRPRALEKVQVPGPPVAPGT